MDFRHLFNLGGVATVAIIFLISNPSARAQVSQATWDTCTNLKNTHKPEVMIKACDTIIQSGKETASNLALAYLSRGLGHLRAQGLERAIDEYSQAIRLKPDATYAWLLRGEALFDAMRYDEAIADLNEAIKLDPAISHAYVPRGSARIKKIERAGVRLNRAKELDLALADLDEAVRLRPDFTIAYNNRGEIHVKRGDLDKAIADFSRAIELRPRWTESYGNRATAYLWKGELTKAEADFNTAIRLDPSDPLNYYQRGIYFYVSGNFPAAAADFKSNIEKRAGSSVNAYVYLWLYMSSTRSGDQTASKELGQNLFKLQAIEWPNYVILLFLEQWGPEKVLVAARGFIEVCEAHFYIGVWHALRGRSEAARPYLQVAIDTCPHTTTAFDGARAELQRLRN